MKNLNVLKLTKLAKEELSKRELSRLQGGNYCAYGTANLNANTAQGLCSAMGTAPAWFMKNTTGW
ncbi:hypothetical protein FACS189415_4500 [Bacteroidia bacterium]|nr:hypothetical protein FACS189415_4500 [Bacteroidia bacterium]